MTERYSILDSARVLGAFLVVFAHLFATYSYERLFIYAFHMPFFFLVSGMLHKYNGKIQTIKYCKKILIPAALYFMLFSIVYLPLVSFGILDTYQFGGG